jgi:class 3 adenylate cyclase
MRAVLAVHDKVLRTAIEAYDGFLFSHTGDGFVAAFASPMSAVNAAIDAQRELQLPARMGLATGEAELRDGDYFGTVLNRAARVCSRDAAAMASTTPASSTSSNILSILIRATDKFSWAS